MLVPFVPPLRRCRFKRALAMPDDRCETNHHKMNVCQHKRLNNNSEERADSLSTLTPPVELNHGADQARRSREASRPSLPSRFSPHALAGQSQGCEPAGPAAGCQVRHRGSSHDDRLCLQPGVLPDHHDLHTATGAVQEEALLLEPHLLLHHDRAQVPQRAEPSSRSILALMLVSIPTLPLTPTPTPSGCRPQCAAGCDAKCRG